MKVQFNIRYHTRYGERLWISGNCEQMTAKDNGPVPMKYLDFDYWTIDLDLDKKRAAVPLNYTYMLEGLDGRMVHETINTRNLQLPVTEKRITIYDTWMPTDSIQNAFYTSPFRNVLLPAAAMKADPDPVPENGTHVFKIKAPLLGTDERICLLGSTAELGNWNAATPVLLNRKGDDWNVAVTLKQSLLPVEYKYGIYNSRTGTFDRFEEKENRLILVQNTEDTLTILQDGYIRLPADTWKGTGVAIPVFSLRSEQGLGIGEFNDIRQLADWAADAGLRLIQLLPVNDTTATFTWQDSYPYAAISAFALHPIYLNIETVAGAEGAAFTRALSKEKAQLNALPAVDYEAVLKLKIAFLKKIFETTGKKQLRSKDYRLFFKQHRHWLEPYAVYCYLRDKYKTVDYSKWEAHAAFNEHAVSTLFKNNPVTAFYCFLQYHLHLQLQDAVAYAHKKGIVIKGDIPIGVFRYGCDTWMAPELYHMHLQAGAPPDDFAVNGQNWGFPTYNWARMQQDGFRWWKARFEQMSHYFDAFRIDHILGFFRIWSIPLDAVQGILGYFAPSLAIEAEELYQRGIHFTEDRFCRPFINEIVLQQLFGEKAALVKQQFLQSENGFDFDFLPAFDNQRKIEAWFSQNNDHESPADLKEPLLHLVANVLLLKEKKAGKTVYHPRFSIDKTISFQALPSGEQQKLMALYNDYFFSRQDNFWREESLKKLPQLKAATDMLICGEDLGLVPDCVPAIMKELGILSLEIQRMPKQPGVRFFDPAGAPYLSVVSPSTHDMSTIRGWWEEKREVTQEFFNSMLHLQGAAPLNCEGWINLEIVKQHLASPAMWSIFQIQDLFGIDEAIRRECPEEERINIPADPNHYWRYRMHLTLESLLENKAFTSTLRNMLRESGR